MIKINKQKARRLYLEGEIIYLIPCKVYSSYGSAWMRPHPIEYDQDNGHPGDFDGIVNSYEAYNCCCELGYYVHFYVND